MNKVETSVPIFPGDVIDIVGDDGSITVEGRDDPEFIKLLHALDRFVAMRNLRREWVGDPTELQLRSAYDNISPRMKRLLREHPLA